MPDKSTDKLIATAKRRFQQAKEAYRESRAKQLDDLEFLSGSPDDRDKQWSTEALRDRQKAGRPALVVNRCDQFVRHVCNAQRQNRVSARVFPVDDSGDIETAEVMQGVVRHVEVYSKADLAYDTAEFYAAAMGEGYYRLVTDYCDPLSFDLDFKIERLRNPFQVFLDPSHQDPTGADAKWGFIITKYTEEEYKQEFPDSDLARRQNWEGFDADEEWVDGEGCTVAEYYYTEYQNETLYRLQTPDGGSTIVRKSQLPGGKLPEGITALEERDTQIPTVKWCHLNAVEVLASTEWVVPRIPIYKVTGRELDVNGRLVLKGILRDLKDAQRQYNLMLSAQTEAAMDRGTLLVAEGQDEGHEDELRTRNRKNPSHISYKPTALGGQPVPPPTRLQPDPTVPALSEARLMAADDLKALTGIYDAALGRQSNETSGRAILSRQQQSDTANFDFQDNLTRAITSSTKDMIDGMPKVYSGPRVVRIIGTDDSQKVVRINQQFAEASAPKGQTRGYDFSAGTYDVVCSAGPSFATKRKEGADALTNLVQVAPQIMQFAPDLVFKSYDFPYAQELAERAKKILPPGLADDEQSKGQDPKLGQAMQMIERLTQELNAAQDALKGKQMEMDTKLQITQMQLQVEVMKAKLDAQIAREQMASNEDIAELKANIDRLDGQFERMHERAMQAEELEFEERTLSANQDLEREKLQQAAATAKMTAQAKQQKPSQVQQ